MRRPLASLSVKMTSSRPKASFGHSSLSPARGAARDVCPRPSPKRVIDIGGEMFARVAQARARAHRASRPSRCSSAASPRCRERRRRAPPAGRQKMRDVADQPGPAQRRAADHHRIGAGVREHLGGVLGARAIAIGDHRNAHGLLDRGDRRPIGARPCRIAGACGHARSPCAAPSASARRASSGALREASSQPSRILTLTGIAIAAPRGARSARPHDRDRASAPRRRGRRSRACRGSPC